MKDIGFVSGQAVDLISFCDEIITKQLKGDLLLLLPEIFFVLTISLVIIYGSIYGTHARQLPFALVQKNTSNENLYVVSDAETKQVPIIREAILWICIQILFVGGILAWNSIFPTGSVLYGALYHDTLTATIKGTVFFFGAFCLLASRGYLAFQKIHAFEYSLLVLLCSFALGLLVSSYDLISLYLSLELQSLGFYVLATFKRGSAFSTEAGLKYFMVGAFGSGLLLFGASLIYGSTGTTNFEDLGRLCLGLGSMSSIMGDPQWYALMGGIIFLSAGLLFKLAAAPFHMWSPDVYEGAPTSSTMIFGILPKMALLGLLIRIYFVSFYDMISVWQSFIIFASISSMIIGSLGALYQRRIKRFLAYSSIGHIAYLLVALSCGTAQGLEGLLLYTFIYMVMSLNIWTVLLSTSKQETSLVQNGVTATHTTTYTPIKYLEELALISRANPALGLSITVAMFSMAGIPPLAGFWAKVLVFFAAMESSLYALAILAVLTSVLGAFYYLRWLKVMFFEKTVSGAGKNLSIGKVFSWNLHHGKLGSFVAKPLTQPNRESSIILAVTTIFMIFFFTYPGPFLLLAHNMVLSICFLWFCLWGNHRRNLGCSARVTFW
jgi:NADH-quinone oxidoreductase subunit N